jgi:hypothetical protein
MGHMKEDRKRKGHIPNHIEAKAGKEYISSHD